MNCFSAGATNSFYDQVQPLSVAIYNPSFYFMGVSKHEKLVRRIQSKPKDFRWEELVRLMESFGFRAYTGSGSSRRFVHETTQAILMLHEPHPGNVLKAYQVRAVVDLLLSEGYLK